MVVWSNLKVWHGLDKKGSPSVAHSRFRKRNMAFFWILVYAELLFFGRRRSIKDSSSKRPHTIRTGINPATRFGRRLSGFSFLKLRIEYRGYSHAEHCNRPSRFRLKLATTEKPKYVAVNLRYKTIFVSNKASFSFPFQLSSRSFIVENCFQFSFSVPFSRISFNVRHVLSREEGARNMIQQRYNNNNRLISTVNTSKTLLGTGTVVAYK